MLWVEIDEMAEHWQQARVDAEIQGAGDLLQIATKNVTALTLRMAPGYCPFQECRVRIDAHAEAEATVPAGFDASPTLATGGGYSGPLAYRQGKPMRPDVAAAFDRMAAAAARAGIDLVINSAFRSDAEQARLWQQNPDPRWVAPPGTSLHRCATELDLGPSTAYAWLTAHAGGFGFLKRYPWEPWHYGLRLPYSPLA